MVTAKVGSKELSEILTTEGWTLKTALDVVYLRTGAVINSRNVTKMLETYGSLSAPLSALFRMTVAFSQQRRELELARGQVSALIGEVNILRGKLNEKA